AATAIATNHRTTCISWPACSPEPEGGTSRGAPVPPAGTVKPIAHPKAGCGGADAGPWYKRHPPSRVAETYTMDPEATLWRPRGAAPLRTVSCNCRVPAAAGAVATGAAFAG